MTPGESALQYADLGWPVFPLHTPTADGCSCRRDCGRDRGKHPRTLNGLKAATTDLTTVAEWWGVWPDANIGLLCGADSGIVVLDIDGDAGFDTLDAFQVQHGTLPETLSVITGSGGAHLYFRHPGGIVRPNAGKIGDGLDIRGDGSYVVAPPSLHMSGNPYEWAGGGEPVHMPAWLLQIIGEAQRKRTTATGAGDVPDGGKIGEGNRNDKLTSIAGAMRRHGAIEAEILAALTEINKRCEPPLEPSEVEKIAASVARYEPETRLTYGGGKLAIRGQRPQGIRGRR